MSACRLHISYFQVYIHHIGVYISDEHCEDQALFVTEKCSFSDLVEGLSSPCPCGLAIKPWALEAVTQVSNIVAASVASCLSQSSCTIERSRVLFSWRRCHRQRRTWSSSRVLNGLYLANQK